MAFNKTFKTMNELQSSMNSIMIMALNNTMERLKSELLDIIREDIYSYPEGWYERTEDLLNSQAWKIKESKAYGNQYVRNVISGIEFDESSLSHDLDMFQHGSIYWTEEDELSADTFLGILNGDRKFGSLFHSNRPWNDKFWDDFEDYCDANFSRILKEELAKLGMILY